MKNTAEKKYHLACNRRDRAHARWRRAIPVGDANRTAAARAAYDAAEAAASHAFIERFRAGRFERNRL